MEKISLQTQPQQPTKPTLSTLLSVAIFIGRLNGCIPFYAQDESNSELKPTSKIKKYCLRILSNTYVGFMAVIQVLVFMIIVVFTLQPLFIELKISDAIILSSMAVVLSSSETLKRIYFMARHSLFRRTVTKIRDLEIEVQARGYCSKSMSNSGIVYGTWAFWALILVVFILETTLVFRKFDRTKLADQLTIFVAQNIWMGTSVFSTILLVGLGFKLLACYKGLLAELINKLGDRQLSIRQTLAEQKANAKWKAPSLSTKGDEVWLDKLDKHSRGLVQVFQEVQECFILFNQLAGFIVLVSVIESGVLALASTYSAFRDPFDDSTLASCDSIVKAVMFILRMVLIAQLGQALLNSMNEAKHQIQCHLLSIGASKDAGAGNQGSSEKALAKHVVAWNWHLTACDLFDVDNKLLLLVVGNVMTYVMFMFQLRIAEETSGLGRDKRAN